MFSSLLRFGNCLKIFVWPIIKAVVYLVLVGSLYYLVKFDLIVELVPTSASILVYISLAT